MQLFTETFVTVVEEVFCSSHDLLLLLILKKFVIVEFLNYTFITSYPFFLYVF